MFSTVLVQRPCVLSWTELGYYVAGPGEMDFDPSFAHEVIGIQNLRASICRGTELGSG